MKLVAGLRRGKLPHPHFVDISKSSTRNRQAGHKDVHGKAENSPAYLTVKSSSSSSSTAHLLSVLR